MVGVRQSKDIEEDHLPLSSDTSPIDLMALHFGGNQVGVGRSRVAAQNTSASSLSLSLLKYWTTDSDFSTATSTIRLTILPFSGEAREGSGATDAPEIPLQRRVARLPRSPVQDRQRQPQRPAGNRSSRKRASTAARAALGPINPTGTKNRGRTRYRTIARTSAGIAGIAGRIRMGQTRKTELASRMTLASTPYRVRSRLISTP